MQRHLIVHIFPVATNGAWQRFVHNLSAHLGQFNGKVVIGIVTGQPRVDLDDPAYVRRFLQESGFRVDHWIESPYDAGTREEPTFFRAIEWLQSQPDLAENATTFFCHAKGVTRPIETTCHLWSDTMLDLLLSKPMLVDEQFADPQICTVGTFRRHGKKLGIGCDWHFSGTFFWFRNRSIDELKNWRSTAIPGPCAVESWPGHQWRLDQSACLFGDHAGNLYDHHLWEHSILPQLPDKLQRRADWTIDADESNTGVIRIDGPAVAADRTIIVGGLARSGTTLMAKSLEAAGVQMVYDRPSYEPAELRQLVQRQDWLEVSAWIRRQERPGLWGFKYPALIDVLQYVESMFSNPHLVVVFRDPVGVAIRERLSASSPKGIYELFQQALDDQSRLLKKINTLCMPTTLVCYQKLLDDPAATVARVLQRESRSDGATPLSGDNALQSGGHRLDAGHAPLSELEGSPDEGVRGAA